MSDAPTRIGVNPVAPSLMRNGPAAAAILATGLGSLFLGIFALLSDAAPAAARIFTIWAPSGALSGVTTAAIGVWLASWAGLLRRWRQRDLRLGPINVIAFMMVTAGLLLTFPPFMDMVQGR